MKIYFTMFILSLCFSAQVYAASSSKNFFCYRFVSSSTGEIADEPLFGIFAPDYSETSALIQNKQPLAADVKGALSASRAVSNSSNETTITYRLESGAAVVTIYVTDPSLKFFIKSTAKTHYGYRAELTQALTSEPLACIFLFTG